MEFKRISAAGLALALCGSLTPALAAETAVPTARLISAPIPAGYAAKVLVNGGELQPVTFENVDPVTYESTEVTVDPASLPGAPQGYVPARLVCAADTNNGYTSWIPEENCAVFSLHKSSVTVRFEDLSIKVGGEKVESFSAYLADGVTFLPVDFLATLPNVEVDDHPEMDSLRYDIKLVVTPLEELANTIREEAGSNARFEYAKEDLQTLLEIPTEDIQALVAYGPMMTNPDTVFIAKVPADKQKPVVEGFKAYQKRQVETFSWYLVDQLPKAENGKVVTEGDYVMLFMGEDSAKAEELFTAGVKALTEAE